MNPFQYTPKCIRDTAKNTFAITTVIGFGALAYTVQALYYISGQKQPNLNIKEAKVTDTLKKTLEDTTGQN